MSNTFNIYCQGSDGENIYIGDTVAYKPSASSKNLRLACVEGIQATADRATVKLVGVKQWRDSASIKRVRIGELEKYLAKEFARHCISLTLEEIANIAESIRNLLQPQLLGAHVPDIKEDSGDLIGM